MSAQPNRTAGPLRSRDQPVSGALSPPVSSPVGPAPNVASATQPAELGSHPLAQVLAAEDRMRTCRTETEFQHTLVNELRNLVGARQVILLTGTGHGKWRVNSISSVASVDRDAPFVTFIESFVARLARETEASHKSTPCHLASIDEIDAEIVNLHPFREGLWQAIRLRNGATFAGILCLRERPWTTDDIQVLNREASVISDIWAAIRGRRGLQPRNGLRRYLMTAGLIAALAAMAIPVPLTALAPVEIVARAPQLVTAPINGVIDKIMVEPNRPVTRGDALLTFVDTELRNAYEIARRDADVAIARHAQITQAAFTDEASRHQIGIAETEMQRKLADRAYAAERLKQRVVNAATSGVLIYADKARWLGKPVSVGERIMRIADPAQVMAQVALPVADAIVLQEGADVRLFLDADPMTARAATVQSETFHATPNATGQLVYKVQTRISDQEASTPRIGSRGTAQVFGATVPLGFFLFRRPIATLRQTFGF